MTKSLAFLPALALALGVSSAQTLQVSFSANGSTATVASGGTAAINANGIGQAATGIVNVTGSTQITNITVGGTSAIAIVSATTLPATSASIVLQYLPTTSAAVTGVVSIFAGGQSPVFSFNVAGSVPSLALSYYFPPNGAATALNSGTQITFPTTSVGSSTNAVVSVLNNGSVTASFASASVSGADFQIAGSPAATTLVAGQQLTFTVVYTPHSSSAGSGSLTVSLSTGTFTFPLAGTAAAPSFVVQYSLADNNAHTLSNGITIAFPSVDVNANTSAVVQVFNQGTGPGTLNSVSVSGAGFQLNGLPALPVSIPANQGVSFRVVFAPTQSGSFSGTLSVSMAGLSLTAGLTGSTAASNFSVRYVDPTNNNVLPLSSGATLAFPNTLAGATSSITVQVVNAGPGTGSIDSIALSGAASAFQLANLAPLPLAVPPAQVAVFTIRFSPQQQQTYTDTLNLMLNGQLVGIALQGQATQPQYTYTWSDGSSTSSITAGGTIAIASTAVGQTASIVVAVTNSGSADGQISTIAVSGQGYSLSNLPALPVTLHAGGSQQFTLSFAPAQPGPANGRLTIGNDTFTLNGSGLGSQLIYSYTSASSSVSVNSGGIVLFPPLTVGATETLSFSIQNTGTAAATISTINLTAPGTAFALSNLPGFPASLDAGATTTITVKFAPGNTGTQTATLQVNTATFTLSGTGTQPDALPSYQLQTTGGTVQAAQQPSIGLALASPYPADLQGTLTLTFTPSAFADDSTIQFASGGRTVNFTIPANTTQALFNGKTSIALQTGTTAGNIVITPSFATQSGFNMTPPSPGVLTLPIPAAAPQLLTAAVSAETITGFTVTLSGYSTSRVLKELDVQFTPKAGQNFSSTSLTIDVSSASSTWFQSTVSQGFGGSFLIAIPFTLSNGSTAADLVHMLQSLSVTAKNDVGASSSIAVSIP